MMGEQRDLAERLFDGAHAESEIDNLLCDVPHERLGWDDYDCSLEIYDVPADYRLSAVTQSAIAKAGFAKVYVNHVDKWETHYTFKPDSDGEGWRVSYPHKRGPGEKSIWVEKTIPTWPQEWFSSGYVIVKSLPSPSDGGTPHGK